jgi:hypothetical protein
MYLTTWPTPSSRLHKADFLEIFCNLTEECKGFSYNVEIHVPNRKAVRPVKPLRGARPGEKPQWI